MRAAGWALFIVSLASLIFIILKYRPAIPWLGQLGLHAVGAAILLYVVNWIGAAYAVHLPINAFTVAAVGVLGVPGLLLLAGVHWLVL